MSKSIRWTKKQKENLSKAVKSYNQKLAREIKKNPDLKEYAPEKLSVKSLKESITTSKELNERLKEIKGIFRKGYLEPIETTSGVKTVKGILDDYEKKVERINKQRQKELSLIPDNPIYYGILGTIESNNLSPKKFNPDTIKPKHWNDFLKSIDAQLTPNYLRKKRELYKQNYIKALQLHFNSMADDLVELISNADAEVVARGFYSSPYLQLSFIYGEEELSLAYETLMEEWGALLSE